MLYNIDKSNKNTSFDLSVSICLQQYVQYKYPAFLDSKDIIENL